MTSPVLRAPSEQDRSTGLFRRPLPKGVVIVAATCAVALPIVLALYVSVYSDNARQSRNMEQARQHIAEIEPFVYADPRFGAVVCAVYTGGPGPGGGILVTGEVEDEEEARALAALLRQTEPPVFITWNLVLRSPREPWLSVWRGEDHWAQSR